MEILSVADIVVVAVVVVVVVDVDIVVVGEIVPHNSFSS